ncbi:hypothetical protein PMAYCL1PPCAC_09710, partial [Pristionchus mayeri]
QRIPLLLALVLFPCLAALSPQYPPENRYPLDRFLLVKPYTRWANKFQSLGSVIATMSEIRLTSDAKGMTGALWSKQTIGLDAFSVEARLRVASTRSSTLVADGFGIWFTERTSLGASYGISPSFTGFGVVFDIYDNTNSRRTPLLGLVASNGTSPLSSDDNGQSHMLASCRVYDTGNLIRDANNHNTHESIAVHIEYAPGKIGVYYKMDNDRDWQHCITHENVFIPNYFFLGVSASTGDFTAQQELISLKVFDLPVDLTVKARDRMHFDQRAAAGESGGKTTTESNRVVSLLFFSLAFFAVVGALVIILKPDLLPGTQASIDKQKRFY